MPFSLIPTWRTWSVTDISVEFLQAEQIRLLMLDFDNTLLPYTTDTPSKAVLAWLDKMKQHGITVCIVSNSKRSRVPFFCRTYGLDYITRAKKPSVKRIRQCLRRYYMAAEQAILVGDQIYTDTLGGNRAGVRTILVKPIKNHNIWLKLRHIAEKPFIYAARNRRLPHG